MRVGDLVKITDGPFAGSQARVASAAERRVLIVVELQGRQFNVEMDLDWIVPAALERKPLSRVEGSGTQQRKPFA